MIPPIPSKWLIAGFALFAAWVLGFGLGAKYVYGKWLDERAEIVTSAVQIVTRQGLVTEKVVTVYKERKAETKVITETIEKEVVRYVPASADSVLPLGWRLLHDAAAARSVPPPTDGINVSAPSVTATEAARAVVMNYGAAHACYDQLTALQGWVRHMFETTNLEPLR